MVLAACVLLGVLVCSTSPASAMETTPMQVVLVEGCDVAVYTCVTVHLPGFPGALEHRVPGGWARSAVGPVSRGWRRVGARARS